MAYGNLACRVCGRSLPDERYRYCSRHRQEASREATRARQARFRARRAPGIDKRLGTGYIEAHRNQDHKEEARIVRKELNRLLGPQRCDDCSGKIIQVRGELVCETCGLVAGWYGEDQK